MRTRTYLSTALAGLMVFASMAATIDMASAQKRGLVKPPAKPLNCRRVLQTKKPATIWWGQFSGAREDNTFVFRPERLDWTSREACFFSKRECDLWLYWMRTRYNMFERRAFCRKGYAGRLLRNRG